MGKQTRITCLACGEEATLYEDGQFVTAICWACRVGVTASAFGLWRLARRRGSNNPIAALTELMAEAAKENLDDQRSRNRARRGRGRHR